MKIKRINYKIILFLWIIIWLLFSIRGFVLHDYKLFKHILFKSIDQKRVYIMKDGLYDFILFSKAKIPEGSDYQFVYKDGLLDPIENFRVAYYLYPSKITKDAHYILVFEIPDYRVSSYAILEKFNESSFILFKK